MPVKYIPYYPNTVEGQAILDNITRTQRVLRYRENDKVYDNSFSGIHTLATAAVLDGEADKVFNFEIKDGPGGEKHWGRWGILTHEKFGEPEIKPRYNALLFLNRLLGDKMTIAGEGSWVKALGRERGGVFRTLVVNYDPNGRHSEVVPITFINLKNGNFTLRRTEYGGATREENVATTSASWATSEVLRPNSALLLELIPR